MPPGKIKTAEPTPNELEELLDASIRVEREANYSQALRWYEPANPQLIHAHLSPAKIIGVFGGNRSGKSEFGAAEVAILATGIVPRGLGDQYPREKLRGDTTRGVRIRVACTDFVNGIEKIILPKFRDGDEHHGPWIPPTCLEGGAWDKAWREKTRTLTVKRDASWAANKRVTDWAHIEFMSYDQETPRFSGTSRHLTWFDELPPYEIWKECQMRHIDAKGRSILTLTPPDTVGDVAWVFDDIYEPGQPIHPRYDPKRIQCFTIFTEHNRFLPQAEVERIRLQLTPEEQETRLHGAFRHLAGLVYPHFRASPAPDGTCHVVEPFDIPRDWPIVMAIDPHPRTPWAMIWAAVDEEGRLWVFDEQWGGGDDVGSYAKIIELHESTHPNKPALRLVDPAASAQNDAMRRGFSIRGELDRCGIRCREAKHDFAAGRAKLIECLRPGKHGPRLFILRSCTQVIYQLTHHIWAEYTGHAVGRDPKQLPQERNKHFPDLLRYLALEDLRVGLRLPGPLRYIPTGGYRPTMLHAPRYTIGTSPAHPDRTRR